MSDTGCVPNWEPDYARPDIPLSDSFRMTEEQRDLPSLANVPWWDLYRDEELQRLIRIALDENKDLKRAVATVDEFAARMLIAKTDFAPQMNATVNVPVFGNTKNLSFPGFPSAFNYYLQGNLAWELDIWGRIRRSNGQRWVTCSPGRKPARDYSPNRGRHGPGLFRSSAIRPATGNRYAYPEGMG